MKWVVVDYFVIYMIDFDYCLMELCVEDDRVVMVGIKFFLFYY